VAALVDALQNKKVSDALLSKGIAKDDFEAVVSLLKNAKQSIILVGSDFMQDEQALPLLEYIEKLAEIMTAGVLPLPSSNNLYGSLMMGAYPELLPGKINTIELKDIDKIKVLYLVGEDPKDLHVNAEFIIYQNIYPASHVAADLTLAAAAFTETAGTFFNGEGRLQQVRKTVAPPGKAYADWEILCQIAQKMGANGFAFSSVAEIQQEIAQSIPAFKTQDREPRPLPEYVRVTPKDAPAKKERHSPQATDAEHGYRGILLTSKVEGFQRIINEGRKDV